MGSEMLLAMMRAPVYGLAALELKTFVELQEKDLADEVKTHRSEVRLRHLAALRIDTIMQSLSDFHVAELGESYLNWWGEDLERPAEEQRAILRQELMLDVEQVVIKHNREVVEVDLEGEEDVSVKWLASGGMSSGDAPTDAYESISRLDSFGLFDRKVTREEYEYALRKEEEIRV